MSEHCGFGNKQVVERNPGGCGGVQAKQPEGGAKGDPVRITLGDEEDALTVVGVGGGDKHGVVIQVGSPVEFAVDAVAAVNTGGGEFDVAATCEFFEGSRHSRDPGAFPGLQLLGQSLRVLCVCCPQIFQGHAVGPGGESHGEVVAGKFANEACSGEQVSVEKPGVAQQWKDVACVYLAFIHGGCGGGYLVQKRGVNAEWCEGDGLGGGGHGGCLLAFRVG